MTTFLILASMAILSAQDSPSDAYTPVPGGWHATLSADPAQAEARLHRRPLYPPADRSHVFTPDEIARIPRSSFRPLVVAYNEPRFLFDFHSAGGLLGHLYIGYVRGDAGRWFHQFSDLDVRYFYGRMVYTIRDAAFPELKINVEAAPLADAPGLIVSLTVEGAVEGDRLVWGYGGASAFFTNYNMTAPEFAFSPAQCAKDRIRWENDSFTLTRAFTEDDVVTKEPFAVMRSMPEWQAVITGASSSRGRSGFCAPDAFGASPLAAASATTWADSPQEQTNCAALQEIPLTPGPLNAALLAVGMGHNMPRTLDNLPAAWDAALARNRDIAARVTVNTPDPWLNSAVTMMAFAQEGTWGDLAIVHGGWSWRFAYLGWRTWYGPTCYGWTDRIRRCIENHTTLGLVKDGPDAGALGSLLEYDPGVFYNMNEVFTDHVRHYFDYSNDLELMGRIFPVLESIVNWESARLQPEGAGLYENALNTWISDSHWYIGGQCTQASAYMLNAYTLLADLAPRLGKDPAPYRARADRIRAALQEKLWMPREGTFAEYLDTRGHRMLHPEPELPTIYHSAEFGAAAPAQIYQMLRWADTHLRAENTPGGGRLVWSSNWYPNRARSYTHSTYEMAYGEELNFALTNWLAGRSDDAYALLRATLCGIYNGPTPGGLSCHSYADGRQRANDEFADASSMWARAVVEGLFGIRPHLPDGYIEVTPGFPSHWDHASIRTPLFSYSWKRDGNSLSVEWQAPPAVEVRFRIPFDGLDEVHCAPNPPFAAEVVYESGFDGKSYALLRFKGMLAKSFLLHIPGAPLPAPEPKTLKQGDVWQYDSPSPIVGWQDPQGLFEALAVEGNTLQGTVKGAPGPGTVFVRIGRDPVTTWMALPFDIQPAEAPPPPKLWRAPDAGDHDLSRWATVDLSPVFNDSVTEVLPHVVERAPAPPMPASQVGFNYWRDHLTQYHGSRNDPISDAAWREKVGPDGIAWTRDGIPFRSPKEGPNIAAVTVTGGFPERVSFPVNASGRTLYLMISGMTFPAQSHVPNLRVTLRYADGASEPHDLVNPFTIGDCWSTWCGRFHDCAANGFENIGGRRGPAGSADVPDLTQPVELDTEAHLVAFDLKPGAELAEVEFAAFANDAVFGVMGASVLR